MTNHNADVARNDFEARFARVTSPAPTTAMGFTAAKIDEAIVEDMASERFKAFIQTFAFANDVQSLQVILDYARSGVPKMDNLLAFMDIEDRTAVTYSVAHMLVDGSGNEFFAEQWMAAFGHNRGLAAEHFRDLWTRPVDTLVHEQIRLGVATLADVFDLERRDSSASAPLANAMTETRNSNLFEVQARELAYLLRLKYPKHLPDIEVDDESGRAEMIGLPDFLFPAHTDNGTHLLPAIALAYETDNASVGDAMRRGIDVMLNTQMLSIEPGVEGFQWAAMQNWGEEGLGKRLWNATLLPSSSFIHAVLRINNDVGHARLAQIEAMGADIQEPCVSEGMAEPQSMRLLDLAVMQRKDGMVGHLLGKGCDPELVSIDRSTQKPFSAASLALAADPTSPDEKASAALGHIQDMIRSHLAKKAALDVIDQLGLAHAGRRP